MSADEGSPREDNNNSIEDGNTVSKHREFCKYISTGRLMEHEFQSIIGKMKSRVSSIFPQNFSKWFTPSADAKNQNGNLRRRRTESEEQEEAGSDEDEEQSITTPYKAPPAKRSRLNVNEVNGSLLLFMTAPITLFPHRQCSISEGMMI